MGNDNEANDNLRPEYGAGFWQGAVRGKYAKQYASSSHLIHLEPDVAAQFHDDRTVNEALRSILRGGNNRQPAGPSNTTEHGNSIPENVGPFFYDYDYLEAS